MLISIVPGGYVGFFDPLTAKHETFTIRGDTIALMRLSMKAKALHARRSVRR